MLDSKLPPEITQRCLSYLRNYPVALSSYANANQRHPDADLFSCTLVSRHLRAIALPMFWQTVTIFTNRKNANMLRYLKENHSKVAQTGCGIDFASYVRQVQVIYYSEVDFSESALLIIYIISLSQLRDLHIYVDDAWSRYYNDDSSNSIFTTIACIPQLHCLTLHNVFHLPENFVHNLGIWGMQLRFVKIYDCEKLPTTSLVYALAEHCPELRVFLLISFCLDREAQDKAFCALVSRCRRLERLEVHGIDFSGRFLAHCAKHASLALRELDIWNRYSLNTEDIVDVSGWQELERLTIQSRAELLVGHKLLRMIQEGCKKLKYYRLERKEKIYDEDGMSFFDNE